MRFPRFLFAQAIINIPVVLVYGLIGVLSVVMFITEQGNMDRLDVYFFMILLMMNLSFVTGVISTVLFFMKSKYSYNALLIYTVSTVIPNIVVFALMIAQSKTPDKMDIIMVGIFSVYPFWLILMALRPYHIKWARAQGKMSVTMFNPKFLIPFILIAFFPLASSFAINKIGIGMRIDEAEAGISFSSSSTVNQKSDFNIANAHDNDITTVWTARYGQGVDPWIRIDIKGVSLPVEGVRISSDETGKYGRPRSVLIETSEGDRFRRELENTGAEQTIPVTDKNYSWIKLTFQSVYSGKEDELSVSEVYLLAKKRNTVNMILKR